MRKIRNNLKHIVYKMILPIYLWSIGFEALDSYIDAIIKDYKNSL